MAYVWVSSDEYSQATRCLPNPREDGEAQATVHLSTPEAHDHRMR